MTQDDLKDDLRGNLPELLHGITDRELATILVLLAVAGIVLAGLLAGAVWWWFI